MSAIDEKIKQLKEQEKQLELEKRKIEFLRHILESAQGFDHADFKEVKDDVVKMLSNFVTSSIVQIELGGASAAPTISIAPISPPQHQPPVASRLQKTETEPSPSEKLNFALENRHLAGKKVSVANDQNVTINGSVVGLDAPFVIVKTDTGPTIKVPLQKVSLG